MDKDIFEQLYRQHYAAALLYAQGLCRSRPLAEDMVQESFCRAWLALPDGVVSFRSWLFRVLRNLIIDHLRRQKHLSDEDVPETADAATPESVLLQGGRGGAVPRHGAAGRRRSGCADAVLLRAPVGGGAGRGAGRDARCDTSAAAPGTDAAAAENGGGWL